MSHHRKRHTLPFIFIIALIATLGSIYYSYFGDPVANFFTGDFFNTANALTPCTLCRYQRVFLYPLTIIAWLALLRKDYQVVYYILPLSILGLIFSVYQYALEQNWIIEKWLCGFDQIGSLCGEKVVEYFGFLTLPLMGILSFLAIFVASYVMMWLGKPRK